MPFFNFRAYLEGIALNNFHCEILGVGGRPELNIIPPIVAFSDTFYIENQHLEELRYRCDRRYNFGDYHLYSMSDRMSWS